MKLRSQIALLLAGLGCFFVFLTYGIQQWVVMPAFTKIERKRAERDLNRCLDTIDRELELLAHATLDWSAWDDLYQFVEDRNSRFESSTLTNDSFEHANMNLLCILNSKHERVWGHFQDLETGERLEDPEFFLNLELPNECLNVFSDPEDQKKGIVSSKHGPLLFASRPILPTDGKGSIRGSMIMGRFLNQKEIAGIAERIHINMTVRDLSTCDVVFEPNEPLQQLPVAGRKVLEIIDQEKLYAYTTINDLFGKPLLLIRANIEREITSQGRISAITASCTYLFATFLTIVACWLVLQWRVVTPLMKMASHAKSIGQRDDLTSKLDLGRDDEIGAMASAFNDMMDCLAESRKKIQDTAHRAGMAEIASEVLHNVGNALTSANCSAEVLDDKIRTSKIASLEKATKLLSENVDNAEHFFKHDPRGTKLIDYLEQLSTRLQTEHTEAEAEVAKLRKTIRHMCEVISAQQIFAKPMDFRQEISIGNLIGHALQLNNEVISKSRIDVVRHIDSMPDVFVNKSKFTQVLVNLIRNACNAMNQCNSDRRVLTISATLIDRNDIEITVKDTGCGFDDTTRDKLFTHGFTTRQEGHGFGLHYCANIVKEAGGFISAQSDGLNCGAAFRIRLPGVINEKTLAV